MPNTTLTARFVSKPNNLHDLNARAAEARPQPTRIKEVVELTAPEFDAFTSNFFATTPWLAGKGGGMAIIDAIEVRAPDRPRLLVNPEGYDYARYVALLDTTLPDTQSEAQHMESNPSGSQTPSRRLKI